MSFNFDNLELDENLNYLESKFDTLKSTIEAIEQFKIEFESINKKLIKDFEITDLNSNDFDIVLNKLTDILSCLNKEYSTTEEQLNNGIKKLDHLRLENFKNEIINIDINQCYVYQLKATEKTVNLLDEFYRSEKDFLILKNAFYFSNNKKYISLIISREFYGLEVDRTRPVISEFKKEYGKQVDFLEAKRLQPLKEKLQKLDVDRNFEDGEAFAFDIPFLIGGQISSNKTGYGNYYFGLDKYYEGTLYGEVTNFVLVGIITNDYYFHLKNGNISVNEKDLKKDRKSNDNGKANDFPLFLIKNIVMLCIAHHKNPIDIINIAIDRFNKNQKQVICFDKPIHDSFSKYLKTYKKDFDYLIKFIYEISILLESSIVKIITLTDFDREKIAKTFIDDKCFVTVPSYFDDDTKTYCLLPNGMKSGEKLITLEDMCFNSESKFPIYARATDNVKYYDNHNVYVEDCRYRIFFSTDDWFIKPFKYNLHCIFTIYYHQEYMQYKKDPMICKSCNHKYMKSENNENFGEWVCPNCFSKNSVFDKYYFKELYLSTEDCLKNNEYVPE